MKEYIWIKLKNKYKNIKSSKQISFETLKTLPVIQAKNELHIPFINSKKSIDNLFEIQFKPKIPLTKKNF